MRTVFILFDSLNRHLLGPYGGTRISTPNFNRLSKQATRFDKHYVGSLPCMPARRDLLTGRLNFLHRSWGPMEPFDNAVPEILAKSGVYSHLITDHCHYWEDGGATYHTRYSSFDFIRGQEGDPWKAMVQPHWERLREKYHETQISHPQGFNFLPRLNNYHQQYMLNRDYIQSEEDFPAAKVFSAGLDFLKKNKNSDNWFLQVETFDPHEPFHAPERFREPFPTDYEGPILDWPRYGRVEELPEECEELRANYYATVAHCDALLGNLLDVFDKEGLWDDTALIVTTDHGFLLGEHDFWAKNRQNLYQEIVHLPLFISLPGKTNVGVEGLTQTADIAATILDIHGVNKPQEMMSHSLIPLIQGEKSKREAALFGYFGGTVNLTDGFYSYHRFPEDLENQEIFQYTLMPTHIRNFFSPDEIKDAKLAAPLSFTKGMPVLRAPVSERSIIPGYGPLPFLENETRLYDLVRDPGQERPLNDTAIEGRMVQLMKKEMHSADAPPEAYSRLQLNHIHA